VPALSVRLLRSALLDAAARVTVTEYVFVVPSCAVTTTVTVFDPTFRLTALALPLVVAFPFTVTVAVLSETAGVTFRLLTAYATLAV
jgi:hypothetical protein